MQRIKTASKEEKRKIIKSIKNYRKAMDEMLTSVSELRFGCDLNPDLNISKKFEDLVGTLWQPIYSQLLEFDQHLYNFYIEFIAKNSNNLFLMSNEEEDKPADSGSSSSFDLNEDLPPPMTFDFTDEMIPPMEFDTDGENFIPSFPSFDNDLDEIGGLEPLNDLEIKSPEVPTILEPLIEESAEKPAPSIEITPDQTAPTEKSQVFGIILENFYKSEKIYRGILFCLNMFYDSILSSCQNDPSNFILTESQKIFGKIPDILAFHTKWLETFENKLNSGDEFNTLAAFFIAFRNELLLYKIHALNAQNCFESLNKLWGNKEFQKLVPKVIDTSDIKISFEDAIQRPTTRISEYFAIITDVISRIQKTDSLFDPLDETKEDMGIFFEVLRLNPKDKKAFTRTIVKWTTAVEDYGGEARRHRLVILFSDYLICAGENMKKYITYN